MWSESIPVKCDVTRMFLEENLNRVQEQFARKVFL